MVKWNAWYSGSKFTVKTWHWTTVRVRHTIIYVHNMCMYTIHVAWMKKVYMIRIDRICNRPLWSTIYCLTEFIEIFSPNKQIQLKMIWDCAMKPNSYFLTFLKVRNNKRNMETLSHTWSSLAFEFWVQRWNNYLLISGKKTNFETLTNSN